MASYNRAKPKTYKQMKWGCSLGGVTPEMLEAMTTTQYTEHVHVTGPRANSEIAARHGNNRALSGMKPAGSDLYERAWKWQLTSVMQFRSTSR